MNAGGPSGGEEKTREVPVGGEAEVREVGGEEHGREAGDEGEARDGEKVGTGGAEDAREAGARASGGGTGWRGALGVLGLALGVRLAVVAWAASRIPPAADGAFYHTIATRIARGLGYTWLWPDGAVTYAGHYPVGYPALVGVAYAIAGPHPAAAMVMNALLGGLAAVAAYRLTEGAGGRRAGWVAGVLVGLHPGLVAYTPALMTEGVTAALVLCAAWAASARFRERAGEVGRASAKVESRRVWMAVLVSGVVVGIATLVRPQSLVLAPIFGWLAARSSGSPAPVRRTLARRVGLATVALAAALAVCAPWTARNCARMGRCALVSYNGGWNLLIGADEAATGAWSEIKVPRECREVFDEAEKDACFGRAAQRYIGEHPAAWLALAPKKLAATFDYAGAGGWYLNAASPQAFPERAKIVLGSVETVFERLLLIAALLAGARAPLRMLLAELRSRRARALTVAVPGATSRGLSGASGATVARAALALALVLGGISCALVRHGWLGYVGLAFVLLLARPAQGETSSAGDSAASPPPFLPAAAAAVLLSLAATHAVFFGAGRYSLVAFPFVTAVAALSFSRSRR